MRSWSPLLIHSRHVRSVVPNPWDPAAPTLYLEGMVDLMFLTREILQSRPVTSYACWNCCSFPVRSCIPTLIPRRHVRSDVPYLWDPAAPSLYPIGMFDLVFPTREILQSHPDTLQACSIRCAEPLRSCSPDWYLVVMFDLMSQPVKSCSSCAFSLCCPNPWDPKTRYACSVLGPNPLVPAAPYTCLLWGPNPWDPV